MAERNKTQVFRNGAEFAATVYVVLNSDAAKSYTDIDKRRADYLLTSDEMMRGCK
jgi:hypothetical protein